MLGPDPPAKVLPFYARAATIYNTIFAEREREKKREICSSIIPPCQRFRGSSTLGVGEKKKIWYRSRIYSVYFRNVTWYTFLRTISKIFINVIILWWNEGVCIRKILLYVVLYALRLLIINNALKCPFMLLAVSIAYF